MNYIKKHYNCNNIITANRTNLKNKYMINEIKIFKVLENLVLPNGKRLTESNIISSIVIKNDSVGFALNITKDDIPYALELKEKTKKIINEALKVSKISVVLTSTINLNESDLPSSKNLIKLKPTGIKKIICITSCKGGVGKSTLTYLLAKELARQNIKVGVFDADIYGPSISKLFNLQGEPEISNNLMQPFFADNIQIMSIGNITDSKKAGIWRGPIVTKTIHQLLFKTNWQNIDILLIDNPPGTGDVALSLAENYHIDGAIIVTTPSDLAVIDNIRTIDMLNTLKIKILGVVENMSYYQNGETKFYPFGKDGGKHIAELAGLKVIAQIPLVDDIAASHENFSKDLLKNVISNLTSADIYNKTSPE